LVSPLPLSLKSLISETCPLPVGIGTSKEILLSSPEKIDASNKRHPLGRVGTSADIAAAAKLLLSDEGSWITGQILHIDGGMGNLK
jgi:NAD(P)-dependent dehydrogenase (short-subunit alcohol dehydrogenase family)